MRRDTTPRLSVVLGLTSCVIRLAIRGAAGRVAARVQRSSQHLAQLYFGATGALFSRQR